MRKWLPQQIVKKVIQMKTPHILSEEDKLVWCGSSDGSFSVKSAYHWLRSGQQEGRTKLWKKIWSWPINEKIKIFLWLIAHNRVHTANLRMKRGASDYDDCFFGCGGRETTLHLMRDCPCVAGFWKSLLKPQHWELFFTLNHKEWIEWNYKSDASSSCISPIPWNYLFAYICWGIWTHRCKVAFDQESIFNEEVLQQCLVKAAIEWKMMKFNLIGNFREDMQQNRWGPPVEGFVRLDVDGSLRSDGLATCGGVVRNNLGNWVSGFVCKLGYVPSTIAEVEAIIKGLELCRMLKMEKVVVASDSVEAINLITRDNIFDHPFKDKLEKARALISMDWEVKIISVFREVVGCTNVLASLAHLLNEQHTIFDQPPPPCRQVVIDDRLGNASLRYM